MITEIIDQPSKKTALYKSHQALHAKMVSFGGFEMPVSYPKGIQSEYFSVRNDVGVFDVSHMGEFIIKGSGALQFLQKLTINDVSKLEVGQAQYSAMCFEHGGIIDDLILYRKSDGYLMVVNATNIQKDYDWLSSHAPNNVYLENISDDISLIALQGPNAREHLSSFTDVNLDMPFYTFEEGTLMEYPVMISRTGYTGELGFEIYGTSDVIIYTWNQLIESGVHPAGLAARDILRMEMAYCLYGNDIDETTHPLEAGLNWITAMDKGKFLGYDKIQEAKSSGLNRRLVAFSMDERGIPRSGYEIFHNDDKIGIVTSGTQSPVLNKGIGLAYVDLPFNQSGQKISVQIRNKRLNAVIIKPPFINKTSLHH